jgi:hypothetical protein
MLCPFAKQVWQGLSKEFKIENHVPNRDLEDWLKLWQENMVNKEYFSLPFFFIYFVWWSRNSLVFQDIQIPYEVTIGLIGKLSTEFKSKKKNKKICLPVMPPLEEGVP